MTFTELEAAILVEAKEKVSPRGTIPTTAYLREVATRAERKIWNLGLETNDGAWRRRGDEAGWTMAANGAGVNSFRPQDELSDVNKLTFVEWQDGSTWRELLPLQHAGDRSPFERNTGGKPLRWYLDNQGLFYVTPWPNRSIQLRGTYVPELLPPANGNEPLLQGQYPSHHEFVLWTCLTMLDAKDTKMTSAWEKLRKDAELAFLKALNRDQGQKTRRIRRASHY